VLGNYPICEAPLAAFPEFAYAAAVGEVAGVSESTFVATSSFNAAVANTGTVSDAAVASSAYFSAVADTANGLDTPSALGVFPTSVSETITAVDSVSVAASVFSAAVSVEQASALDSILAYSVFIAATSGGATGADTILARYLWEIIDDSQPSPDPGWQNVNTN